MANITFSFASGLNDSIFGKSQAPIKAMIERKAEAYEQASMLKQIFNHNPSRHFAEKYTTMTAMDGPQPVGEGGAYPVDGTQEGFSKTIEHMVWKDSFHLTREAVDDGKIIDLKKRPKNFISGFYRVKEEYGAAMLGGAVQGPSVLFKGQRFDTTGADGKALFCKDHPYALERKKGVQSNLFAGELTAANLGKLETAMQNVQGDAGETLAVAPKTIIIPNDGELKNRALEAIGSDKDPQTGNNGFNYQYGRWNLIVWPYLNFLLAAGLKPWILLDPDYNEDYDCAILQQRVKLDIKSDIAANDDNMWKGYERYSIGFSDWRGLAVGGVDGGTVL